MADHLQVSFLPWLGLRESFCLGPITLWPFTLEAEKRIADQGIRDHLTKYFRSYVDHQGKPVDRITVCSHRQPDFRCLDDPEYKELRSAIDIFTFATIAPQIKVAVCADNRSMGPPSAEMFEMITQNFRTGSDDIAVRAGTIVHGGWKIGEITFPKPLATGGTFGDPDKELVKGFDSCFTPEFPVAVRERFSQALEWFRMSHAEGSDVSALSKVVMMATAFEILLHFPRQEKRKYFVEYMEKHVASDKFHKDNRTAQNGKTFPLSLGGCWAWDFYELRSRIVHGDQVPATDLIYRGWLTHLIVADLVFLECVKRDLFLHGCIGENVRACTKKWHELFPGEPLDTLEKTVARWLFGFSNVHEALGWIPKTEAEASEG